jgi:hypothetical protein
MCKAISRPLACSQLPTSPNQFPRVNTPQWKKLDAFQIPSFVRLFGKINNAKKKKTIHLAHGLDAPNYKPNELPTKEPHMPQVNDLKCLDLDRVSEANNEIPTCMQGVEKEDKVEVGSTLDDGKLNEIKLKISIMHFLFSPCGYDCMFLA